MRTHHFRDDVSRFLVHLTRNSERKTAEDHLLEILRNKTLYAKNAHCFISRRLKDTGFSNLLRSKFNTVCFTETPLSQLSRLTGKIHGRRIWLRPYGLVFSKQRLLQFGATPAIYINAQGTYLREYLNSQFDEIFEEVKKWRELRETKSEHYNVIVQYYSLINVVSKRHNFLWEREWRFHGNFQFNYKDIVALIAAEPQTFEKRIGRELGRGNIKHVRNIPIISPSWSYEEVVEAISQKLRSMRSA